MNPTVVVQDASILDCTGRDLYPVFFLSSRPMPLQSPAETGLCTCL